MDYTDQTPSYATAAGGAISTAGDMATWIRTLVSGGVFDPGYLARAATGSGAQSRRITLCDG